MSQDQLSRRACLRGAAVGGINALVATGAGFGVSRAAVADSPRAVALTSKANDCASEKIPITIAGYPYDRVEALIDGRVAVEGCDARFEVSSIGDMNTHIFSGPQTRVVTEVGLSPFMLAFANDEFRDYSLLPVFPLRLFRHRSIFVGTDSGIEKPEDLRGRKVATTGYSTTSLIWIRGFLEHEYGVSPQEIEWVISAKDSSSDKAGARSAQESVVPDDLSITTGPDGKDESDMLVDGDVDALFHAAEPKAWVQGDPRISRLFTDYRSAERDYFAKTGIFPIMHAVAIRNDAVEQHPWLPRAVFNAYSDAKRLTFEYMQKKAWYLGSLPWFGQEFSETRELMGENFWSYGVEANRRTLEALFEYSHEQGLASRMLTIEELFHPLSLEWDEDHA